MLSVFLDQGRKKHTTDSWGFLMLNNKGVIRRDSLWKKANFSEDVIIANVDTGTYVYQMFLYLFLSLYCVIVVISLYITPYVGVWPDSKSFSDEGYGQIPAKWKGTCDRTKISCNKYVNNFFFSLSSKF